MDEVVELFGDSPEAVELIDEGIGPQWIHMMFEYAHSQLGVTAWLMSANNLRETLFDIFPRKVSGKTVPGNNHSGHITQKSGSILTAMAARME